jgi:hypothetical protein
MGQESLLREGCLKLDGGEGAKNTQGNRAVSEMLKIIQSSFAKAQTRGLL